MGRAGGAGVGVVALILVILGYIMLGLLSLFLLLLAVVLWSPVEFSGWGTVHVTPAGDPMALSGLWAEDELAEDEESELFDGEELEITADATAHGRVRLLWGAVEASDRGVRVLWWRPRRGGGGERGVDGGHDAAGRPEAGRDTDRDAVAARIRARVTRRAVDVEVEAGAGGKGTGAGAEERAASRRRRKRGGVRFTLRDFRRLWPGIRRSLARSWRALSLRLRLYVTAGLDDPATTGLLAGFVPAVVIPVTWSTNARRPGSITIRFVPVFDRETLAADFELAGRTTVYGVTIAWIRLALRRDVRRLWWPRRRRKEKGGPK